MQLLLVGCRGSFWCGNLHVSSFRIAWSCNDGSGNEIIVCVVSRSRFWLDAFFNFMVPLGIKTRWCGSSGDFDPFVRRKKASIRTSIQSFLFLKEKQTDLDSTLVTRKAWLMILVWLNSKDTHNAYYHYNFSSFISGGGLWSVKSDCFLAFYMVGKKPCRIIVDACSIYFSWEGHFGTSFLWRRDELDEKEPLSFLVPILICIWMEFGGGGQNK